MKPIPIGEYLRELRHQESQKTVEEQLQDLHLAVHFLKRRVYLMETREQSE